MAHVVNESLPGTHEAAEKRERDSWLSSTVPIQSLDVELDAGDRDIFQEFTYCQGAQIRGHLLMKTFAPFYCKGVEVALEGTATVNYKSGNVVVQKKKDLLPFEWAKVSLFTPTTQNRVGSFQIPGGCAPLPIANYRIPFCITIPKNFPFPGTFKGDGGKIQYRVLGIAHSVYAYPRRTVHAHKTVRVESYFSLRSEPAISRPLVSKYSEDNSLFFKSSCLKFSFILDQTGFIGGDPIHFIMRLSNPKKKHILELTASLKKKLEFAGGTTVKSKLYILDVARNSNLESEEDNEVAELLDWEDSLNVPQDVYPTTKRLNLIRHQYFIQVEVRTAEAEHSVFTKNIPIVVGTVRDGEVSVEDNWSSCRSVSMLSIESFAESESGLPPAYSVLSSRRSSVQTLPPLYETL